MDTLLQLERYFFDDIVIGAVGSEIPDDSEHRLRTDVQLQRHNEDEHRWRLELRIYTDNKEDNPPPKYGIGLRVVGFFRDSFEDLDQDQRAHLVNINGSSILYSAAREFILMITNRCPHGGYWLPTMNFFKKVAEDQKSADLSSESKAGE